MSCRQQDNPFFISRGDDRLIRIRRVDANGAALPFEDGERIYFTVKYDPVCEKALITKVVSAFPDGVAMVELAPGDTKGLMEGLYYCDVQYRDLEGHLLTYLPPHLFEVGAEVTRDE